MDFWQGLFEAPFAIYGELIDGRIAKDRQTFSSIRDASEYTGIPEMNIWLILDNQINPKRMSSIGNEINGWRFGVGYDPYTH